MAVSQIPNLPPAIVLSGAELLEAVQAGASVKVTVNQISDFVGAGGGISLIQTSDPISGGTITTTGTIGLKANGVTNGFLGTMPTLTLKANLAGGTAQPTDASMSAIIDATIGSVRGSVLYRGAAGWTYLPPSTAGQFLQTNGSGADPAWASAGGSGTVTNIATTAPISGGPITGTGTLSLAANGVTNAFLSQMASHTIKGNATGGAANAADLTATQVTALLNPVTSSLQGVAPATGGGTVNFLRADATWADPIAGLAVPLTRPFNLPPSGFISTATGANGSASAATPAAGELRLFPIMFPVNVSFSTAVLRCVQAGPHNAKLVLFSSDGSGWPSSVISQSSSIPTTTVGMQSYDISGLLLKNVQYWIGIWADGGGTFSFGTWPTGSTPYVHGHSETSTSIGQSTIVDSQGYNPTLPPVAPAFLSANISTFLPPAIGLVP